MSTSPASLAAARKQAQVLTIIADRRLAGIALTMGVGKTLFDMARLLADLPPPTQPASRSW